MLELHYYIIQRVSECIALVNSTQGTNLSVPSVRFDIRGKTAGMALLQRWQLRFNPVLLAENPEAFLRDVVPHEVSHLIVYSRFGKVRPHGREWQWTMQHVFNIQPKTTHNFNITSVEGKTFPYLCGCNVIRLSIRRHNKAQRQQVQYICRRCKQTLTWQTPNT